MTQVVDFGTGTWLELAPGVRMQPLFGDGVLDVFQPVREDYRRKAAEG